MKRLIIAAAITLGATSAYSADLKLTDMSVKQNLKAGVPYDVSFRYEGDASNIREVCFLWNTEGPYCWKDLRVDAGSKRILTMARTGNPSRYKLTGFVRYGLKNSNKLSRTIIVK